MSAEMKPYWENPAPLRAETEQLELRREEDGLWLRVADCIFYPESGGQRADRGWLCDEPVLDVQLRDGQAWLRVEREPVAGSWVQVVDEMARRDHSEQHSGQHLLSAVFDALAGAATLSFHMGRRSSTIELDIEEPSAALDADVAARCDALVRACLPLSAFYPTAEERDALELRKDPGTHEILRVVEVAGIDRSACGGTHVANTGELGAIYLGRWERIRGRWRVEFLAGGRAVTGGGRARQRLRDIAEQLSCGSEEIDARVASLLADAAHLPALRKRLRSAAASARALELAAAPDWRALPAGGQLLIWAQPDEDEAEASDVAAALCAEPGRFLLIHRDIGGSLQLHVQRSRGEGAHLGNLLRELLRERGGRGGGGPERAQGQIPVGEGAALLDALCEKLEAEAPW